MGPDALWLVGIYAAHRRNTLQLHAIDSALTAEADTSTLQQTKVRAQAIHAHRLLVDGDTAAALQEFSSLKASGGRAAIEWLPWPSFGWEHLVETRLRLARRDYVGALRSGSVFDSSEPMPFVLYRPESLRIRLRAAEALRRPDLVKRFQSLLAELGPEAAATGRIQPDR